MSKIYFGPNRSMVRAPDLLDNSQLYSTKYYRFAMQNKWTPGAMQVAKGAGVIRRSMRHGFCVCLLLVSDARADSSFDLSRYRGRVVYPDFWASCCGPCRQSFPWMEIIKSTYEVQGLEIVAVNLDRDRAAADKFLNRFRPTFDVRFDPNGELAELYKVQGYHRCG
jgi:hypothetical protein